MYEDYAHHPTRDRSDAARGAHAARTRAWSPSSSRTCTRARRCSRGEFGRALALADVVAVLDVYPARERAEDHPGVSGLLIARASADAARGRAVYWLPTLRRRRALSCAACSRAGDLCVVMGAGDVDALGRALAGSSAT